MEMIENAAEFNVLLHAWMQWWEVSHTGNLKLIKQRLQKFLLLTQVSTARQDLNNVQTWNQWKPVFSFEWLQVHMCLFPFKYLSLTSTSYLGCRCSRYSYLLYFWGCVTSPMYNKLYNLCWSYFVVNQSLLLNVRVFLTLSHNCIGRKRSCTVVGQVCHCMCQMIAEQEQDTTESDHQGLLN